MSSLLLVTLWLECSGSPEGLEVVVQEEQKRGPHYHFLAAFPQKKTLKVLTPYSSEVIMCCPSTAVKTHAPLRRKATTAEGVEGNTAAQLSLYRVRDGVRWKCAQKSDNASRLRLPHFSLPFPFTVTIKPWNIVFQLFQNNFPACGECRKTRKINLTWLSSCLFVFVFQLSASSCLLDQIIGLVKKLHCTLLPAGRPHYWMAFNQHLSAELVK